ncbi:slit homolog 3 protein [Anoplophora glabripennis]|nr:slit homolog 3 protein [Anoplophora glabripennis]
MNILNILLVIVSIKSSRQWCRSTVGFTTCGNEKLTENNPLRIADYKHLLEFEGGYLEEIPTGSFKLLPEVNILHISNNHVKTIEKGAFDGLQQLQKLILYNNELRVVNQGVFRNCRKLKSLDLGQNEISDVETNAFADLPSLEELNLGFNNLLTVPTDVNKIKSLLSLKLNNNKLSSLDANAFNNLNKLEVLDLSDNQIRAIPNSALAGLSKLKELNLKSNYISNLNVQNVLSDLRTLAVVKLSINSFNCRDLNSIINAFGRKGVEVAKGFSKSQDQINGIGCKRI